jgi:hypothetical protein
MIKDTLSKIIKLILNTFLLFSIAPLTLESSKIQIETFNNKRNVITEIINGIVTKSIL